MGFSKKYWDENYAQPKTMDCIGNAHNHVKYLKALFTLEVVEVSSMIDLGFGYGYLFQKMLSAFKPYKACGIESSEYAFNKAIQRNLAPDNTKLTLYNETIQDWCSRKESKKLNYDLGICTSVFQYLSKEDLEFIVPVLSMRIKYLYLTVPTDIELKRQVEELNFYDRYAIRRKKEEYYQIIKKHFICISSKLWESKYYFDEENTHFTDLLYRF